jgi:hypothetical protein
MIGVEHIKGLFGTLQLLAPQPERAELHRTDQLHGSGMVERSGAQCILAEQAFRRSSFLEKPDRLEITNFATAK